MTHAKWTDAYRERFSGLQFIGMGHAQGLSDRPDVISHGRNSGHQAVSLAAAFGASRIILLGYDMQAFKGKAQHFFGEHRHNKAISPYPEFRAHFQTLAAGLAARGIAVINCSRRTALTCVPRGTLGDALGSVAA